MHVISVLGTRGGSGKSTLSAMLALGATRCGYRGILLSTDGTKARADEELQDSFPYTIVDATDAAREGLEAVAATYNAYLSAYQDDKDVVMVIDGCANRRDFDQLFSEGSDYSLVAATPDHHAVRDLAISWEHIKGKKGLAISRWRQDVRWQADRQGYIDAMPAKPVLYIPEQSALVHLGDETYRHDYHVAKAAQKVFLHVAYIAGIIDRRAYELGIISLQGHK